jgi:XTP/dITP diphosphohydrolase
MTQPLVVATRNPGKIEELRRLLADLPLRLLSLTEAGVDEELAETGTTFAANAIQKAERTRTLTGLPALADDSGLCVDVLGGAPGVRSARYGGPGLTDHQRLERLLLAVATVPPPRRTARFMAVVALARPGQYTVTTEGRVEGCLTERPIGSGGFGYDPIFYVPALGTTTADVAADVKDAISHRGRAMQEMRAVLAAWLGPADP